MIAKTLIHRSDRETLRKRDSELAGVRRIANLGNWEWDLIRGKALWSDQVYRIYGQVPGTFAGTREAFYNCIHPDDRRLVRDSVARSVSDPAAPYSIRHRIIRPDGSERVVRSWAEVSFDANGKALRMKGKVWDITERRQAEEGLKKALREIRQLEAMLTVESPRLKEDFNSPTGFPEIVGASDPLKYVLYRVQQVARTKTTVLLTGETGAGKDLFARSLYKASDRKDKPFVNVNCAGLPANLIESELFGREKGAFTGSTARQIGRFELADGGTIFLDEIGELPLDLQSKLLKVIESGEFERLGSPRTVKVDVRIVACTNRNLEEEVEKGQFRKDLFYRLNVFPITIPPLRERRRDIPLLVKFFVEKFGRVHGKDVKEFPEKTMQALENYSWPGNVRELINVIESAVIMSDGPVLRLTEKINAGLSDYARQEMPMAARKRGEKGLAEIEREHILTTLRGKGWLIDGHNGAARLLGINPSTLRSRMKKLGIARPR
jgi:PAS domain S-box-containing protein